MIHKQKLVQNRLRQAGKLAVFAFAILLMHQVANAQIENYQLYRIIATHSNKCVDVAQVSDKNNQAIWQYTCQQTPNQTWEFVAKDSNSFLIRARHSGKCLDVQNGFKDNGTPIVQYDCHGGDNQRWTINKLGGGYQIKSAASGSCMDVRGPSSADSAILQIWGCAGASTTNQIFNLAGVFSAEQQKSFQMIFASDPQFPYCESNACKSGPKNSQTANEWHSAAINKLMAGNYDIKGVVVNGDLSNTMEQGQLDVFENLYVKKFMVYPGLGNHDYQNYTPANNDRKAGVCDGNAISVHGSVCNLFQYFAKTVRANKNIQSFDWKDSDKWERSGSFAYYWDIGDYRFIQLNNFPPFSFKFSNYASNKVGNENFDIQSSLSWLRTILSQSKNKKVILNMHSINSGDGFGESKWDAGRKEFGRILGDNTNVVAIFGGHLHWLVGDDSCKSGCVSDPQTFDRLDSANNSSGKVPVLFSGSAEYNLLLSVKFEPKKITATPYRTVNGKQEKIGTAKVITIQ